MREHPILALCHQLRMHRLARHLVATVIVLIYIKALFCNLHTSDAQCTLSSHPTKNMLCVVHVLSDK